MENISKEDSSSVGGFITRFAITHTAVYFLAGMVFMLFSDYKELFASSAYSFMRTFDHPLVILGPSLQIVRGTLLALAFLPFRKTIIENKRGWLYIASALFILMHVGADAADPGKIESFIYADFPLSVHFSTWPEFLFSTPVFAWLFHTWQRNPKDKRLTIPLVSVAVITVVMGTLGIIFI